MSDRPLGATDFLLDGDEPGADLAFTAPPPRAGCRISALVDGAQAFPAMERAIAKAEHSVWVASWIFNPLTPLLASDVRAGGVGTWGDLLRVTAARGVDVRVLLADFDPLLARLLHMTNWRAYLSLARQSTRAGTGNLEVVVSRHEATAKLGVGDKLSAELDALVRALNGKEGVNRELLAVVPGAWRLLRWDAKTRRVARREGVALAARPATHHQKFCVIDGHVAFCGGLDHQTGRIDSATHSSAATAWHDVHCLAEGSVVQDVARNFALRWNDEQPRFAAFRDDANRTGLFISLPVLKPGVPLKIPAAPAAVGSAVAQAQRTLSEADWSPYPENLVDDVAEAYERAISAARRYVYIENQYVRSVELKNWLVARARKADTLQIIIVLPVAPEEVGAKGSLDAITAHGLHLQHEVLTELGKLRGRFGAFSMVKRTEKGGRSKTAAFGSPQVYVHSKCLIVDDALAIVGSANANPRSFKTDTELNLAWHDPASVTRLKHQLWNELLGSPRGLAGWADGELVRRWTEIAKVNEKAEPKRRQGFIVRHNANAFPGTEDARLTQFAGLFDPETGKHEMVG